MARERRSRDKFATERPRMEDSRQGGDRSRSRSKERKLLLSKEVERLARRVVKAEIKSRDGKTWNQVK